MAANDKYKKRLATASLEQAQAMDKAYTDALTNKKKKYSYNGLEYAVDPNRKRILAADVVKADLEHPKFTPTAAPEHPKFTPGTKPVPEHPKFTPQPSPNVNIPTTGKKEIWGEQPKVKATTMGSATNRELNLPPPPTGNPEVNLPITGKKTVVKTADNKPVVTKTTVKKPVGNFANTGYAAEVKENVAEYPTYPKYAEIKEQTPNIRTDTSTSYVRDKRPLENKPELFVLHHTGVTEDDNEKWVRNTFKNPKSGVSSHVVIEEDGKRSVYADPNKVTFHAGESQWGGRKNVNDFSVGVEFQGDTNKRPLTDAQIESFIEYAKPIAKQYGMPLDALVTHQMITRNQKGGSRKPDIAERDLFRVRQAVAKHIGNKASPAIAKMGTGGNLPKMYAGGPFADPDLDAQTQALMAKYGTGQTAAGATGIAGAATGATGAGGMFAKGSNANVGAGMGLQAGAQAINMIDGMDGRPSKLGGVASGALSGASMGMAAGPWGAAAGAAIGGGLALLQAEQAKKEQQRADKRYMSNLTDQNNFTSQQTLRNYASHGITSAGSYAWGGNLSEYGKGGKIHIKPENRGKFTAYKKRTGKTTEEALHSKDPHVRKMANFAKNAKKWKHPDGGLLDKVGQHINRNVTKNIRQTLPINAAMYMQDLTGNLMKQTGDNFLTRGEPTPLTEKDLTPEELAVMRQTQQNAVFDRRRVMEQTGRKRVPKEIGYDSYPNEDREIFEPDPRSVYELIHALKNPTNRMATTVGGAMYHKNDKGEDVITDRFNFAGKQEPGLARKNIEANPRNPYGYLHSFIANYGSNTEDSGIPVNINLGKPKPVLTKGKKSYALGGMQEPEYEVEGGEMIQGQGVNLEQQQQVASDMVKVPDYAPSHAEGGVDGAGGDRVFSDRLKTANKKTYAEEAEQLGKQKAKYEAKIPSTNEAIRNTGERMSERMDMKLDELFNEQEMKKMYAMPSSISSSMAMAYGGHLPKFTKGGGIQYSPNNPYRNYKGKFGVDSRTGLPANTFNQSGQYSGTEWGNANITLPEGHGLNPYPYDVKVAPDTSMYYEPKNYAVNNVDANKSGITAPIRNLTVPTLPTQSTIGTGTSNFTGGATAKAMKNGSGIPWQYVDNLASGIATANTPQLAKPYMDPRVDLNTNYDINPQLSSARNTRDALNRSIAASTPQGGASAANRQQLFASSVENENGLYAQKNNIENELKNKEILVNSNINSRNNEKRYAYDEQNVARRAGIQEDIVGNARNFAQDQYTSARDAKMDARDLENIKQIAMANPNGANYAYELKAFADMYASDPAKLAAAISQMQAMSPNAPALPFLINMQKNLLGK